MYKKILLFLVLFIAGTTYANAQRIPIKIPNHSRFHTILYKQPFYSWRPHFETNYHRYNWSSYIPNNSSLVENVTEDLLTEIVKLTVNCVLDTNYLQQTLIEKTIPHYNIRTFNDFSPTEQGLNIPRTIEILTHKK